MRTTQNKQSNRKQDSSLLSQKKPTKGPVKHVNESDNKESARIANFQEKPIGGKQQEQDSRTDNTAADHQEQTVQKGHEPESRQSASVSEITTHF